MRRCCCCCFYFCCSRLWLPLLSGLALLLTLFTIVYDKRQGGLLNATAKVVAGAPAVLPAVSVLLSV
jgi:hypothetical protein